MTRKIKQEQPSSVVFKTARQLLEEQENGVGFSNEPVTDKARIGTSDGHRRSDVLHDV